MLTIRFFCSLLSLAVLGEAAIIPRADPPLQEIPATGKADNTFNFGTNYRKGEPAIVKDIPPAVYGSRSIDLPFGRLYHGNMTFFRKGQLNTPNGIVDEYKPGENDFACKTTDPNDPTHCATPADIKVIRSKVAVMEHLTGPPIESIPELKGDQFPQKTWWFFAKCWADGLAQPAYQGPQANNWFTTPPLPNNIQWAQSEIQKQYKNNQIAYPGKGWPAYPMGAYKTTRDATTSPLITDWVPGAEPEWKPVAGGKGWGKGPETQAQNAAPALNLAAAAANLAAKSSSCAQTTVYISTNKQVPAAATKKTSSPLLLSPPKAASTSKSQAPIVALTKSTAKTQKAKRSPCNNLLA